MRFGNKKTSSFSKYFYASSNKHAVFFSDTETIIKIVAELCFEHRCDRSNGGQFLYW